MTSPPPKPGQFIKSLSFYRHFYSSIHTSISMHLFYMEIILNHELLTQYTCTLCEVLSLEKKYFWLYYTKIEFFSTPSHVLLF